VAARGSQRKLKSKVHKSRKYDFLFGDDKQKDNFLNPNRAEGVAVPEGGSRWAEGGSGKDARQPS